LTFGAIGSTLADKMTERKGTLLKTAYEIAITNPVKKSLVLPSYGQKSTATNETPLPGRDGEYQKQVEKAEAFGRLIAEVVKGITNNIPSKSGIGIQTQPYISRYPVIPGDYS